MMNSDVSITHEGPWRLLDHVIKNWKKHNALWDKAPIGCLGNVMVHVVRKCKGQKGKDMALITKGTDPFELRRGRERSLMSFGWWLCHSSPINDTWDTWPVLVYSTVEYDKRQFRVDPLLLTSSPLHFHMQQNNKNPPVQSRILWDRRGTSDRERANKDSKGLCVFCFVMQSPLMGPFTQRQDLRQLLKFLNH